jgi:two-component system sensor histidine kinase/response regulator
MESAEEPVLNQQGVQRRTAELFDRHNREILERTDRLFGRLMVVQWFAGILAAAWISPRAWSGQFSETHIHVWFAIFLGGAIALLPAFLAIHRPAQTATRHVIAVGQILTSALLIHLTGGRIETHFHVFGSLAFLAFYRDWRVLVTGSLVVTLDHLVRGIFWPQSVYGVLISTPWRSFEHAGWVVFEDVILTMSCLRGRQEMIAIAMRQARLEATKDIVEAATTELKKSEERLRTAKDVAEAANEAKDEFLANVSHELRTPLHGILSFAEIGLAKADKVGPEKVRGFFEKINLSANRLLALVNDLLDQAKLEAGKMTFEFAPTDMGAIVACIVDEFRSLLSERNQTVLLLNRVETTVITDATRVLQVLRNLISNALKFSPVKGEIEVAMEHVDGDVRVAVSDRGVGIPADELESIFEKFVQTRKTRSGAGGTGLGLSICREIIAALGGKIWAENRPGGGSTFVFTLPVRAKSSAEPNILISEAASAVHSHD